MEKYANGKIYRLSSLETGEFYIGSTIQSLNTRLSGHKSKKNTRRIYELTNQKDCQIELIEDYPCESSIVLRKREAYYQRLHKDDVLCINCRIEDRTHDEWIIENKEHHKSSMKELYKKNKDIIKTQHKEKAEEIAKYQKKYRLDNKEKLKVQCIEWKNKNKDTIQSKSREYIKKNRDKINQRNREKTKEKNLIKNEGEKIVGIVGLRYNCCCGSNVDKYERNKHFSTKKHQMHLSLMNKNVDFSLCKNVNNSL